MDRSSGLKRSKSDSSLSEDCSPPQTKLLAQERNQTCDKMDESHETRGKLTLLARNTGAVSQTEAANDDNDSKSLKWSDDEYSNDSEIPFNRKAVEELFYRIRSEVAQNIEAKNVASDFSNLPENVLVKIFSFSTQREILHTCRLVCKHWFVAGQNNQLWKKFPDFDVEDCEWCVEDSDLFSLPLYAPGIEELDLTSYLFSEMSEVGLSAFIKSTNLREFSCDMMNVENLKLLEEHSPDIQSLKLIDVYTDETFDPQVIFETNYFPKLNNLSSLELSNCVVLTDKHMETIFKNCTKLKEIELQNCSRAGEQTLKLITFYFPGLKKLWIGHDDNVMFTSEGIRQLSKLHELVELKFRLSVRLSLTCVRDISMGCTKLETLLFEKCHLNDIRAYQYIAANLEFLRIFEMGTSPDPSKAVGFLAQFGAQLEKMIIADSKVSYEAVEDFCGKCSTLDSLVLPRGFPSENVDKLYNKFPEIRVEELWFRF